MDGVTHLHEKRLPTREEQMLSALVDAHAAFDAAFKHHEEGYHIEAPYFRERAEKYKRFLNNLEREFGALPDQSWDAYPSESHINHRR